MSNRDGLTVKGFSSKGDKVRKIIIKRVSSSKVLLNNRIIVNGSLWVSSKGAITVQRIGSSAVRRYLGTIQVKPFAKGLYVVNHIATESYLEGVLNAEISTNWHIEVVKAQSVISRTFALYKKEKRHDYAWHLSASHFDQVYKGIDIADDRGRHAIRATSGIVVNHNGGLAQTFYHSNSGGMTEDPGNIWQYSLPYLQIRSVPYGQNDPRYYWETTISDREIKKILRKSGIKINKIQDIFISKRTPSNRAYELVLTGNRLHTMLAYNFRKNTGYKKIQSLLFDVIKVPGGFIFKGRGNGHGVGLSQWSAKEMAEIGYKFNDILHFFYYDIKLRRYSG